MRPRLTRAVINQRLRYRRIEMTGDYSGPKVKAGFRCDHCGFCWVTSWGCIEWGCGCPECGAGKNLARVARYASMKNARKQAAKQIR